MPTAITTTSSSNISVDHSSILDHDSTIIFKCHKCSASFHVSWAHIFTKMGGGRLAIRCPRGQCEALVCHSNSLPVQESSSLPASWKEGAGGLSINAPGMDSSDNFTVHLERTDSMDASPCSPRDSMYSDSLVPLKPPGPSASDVIAGVGSGFDPSNQRRSSASTINSAGGARKGSAGSLSLMGVGDVAPLAPLYSTSVTESPRNSVYCEGNLRKLAARNMSLNNLGRSCTRTHTIETTSSPSASRRNSGFVEGEHGSSSSPSRTSSGLESQQDASPEVIRSTETAGAAQDHEAAPSDPSSYDYLAAPSSSGQDVSQVTGEKESGRQPDLEEATAALQTIADAEKHADDAPPSTPVPEENKKTKRLQRLKVIMSKMVGFFTKRRMPIRGKGKGKKQKEEGCKRKGKGNGEGQEGPEIRAGRPGRLMLDVPDPLAGGTLVPPSPAAAPSSRAGSSRNVPSASAPASVSAPAPSAAAEVIPAGQATPSEDGGPSEGAETAEGFVQENFDLTRREWQQDVTNTVGEVMRQVPLGTAVVMQMEVTSEALAAGAAVENASR
ncbi:hypothetical protein K440DRAFT_285143 [Wilcoxina mikolae CBS 423.85]|nr:hypothetical protein K440DRAFT_285143 [Wilcoxina mikolae CBS 423.85]